MANECLVTKLKGVVNNPNLLKLGECKVVCYAILESATIYENFHFYSLSASESVTLTIISENPNLYFTLNNDGVNLGKTISGTSFSKVCVNGLSGNESVAVKISNMYLITSISSTRFMYIDFESVYFSGLTNELVAHNPDENWDAVKVCPAVAIQCASPSMDLTGFLSKFP